MSILLSPWDQPTLLMLEIAQPAKEPAAPAAELTKAVGTEPVLFSTTSSSLLAAVSGCEDK